MAVGIYFNSGSMTSAPCGEALRQLEAAAAGAARPAGRLHHFALGRTTH